MDLTHTTESRLVTNTSETAVLLRPESLTKRQRESVVGSRSEKDTSCHRPIRKNYCSYAVFSDSITGKLLEEGKEI